MKEDLMEERRKFSRLDISVSIMWRRLGSYRAQAVDDVDVTLNIAEGGVCLMADERFQVGERLELTLTLPSQKTIQTLGQVVWVKDAAVNRDDGLQRFDIGVAFSDLPEKEWQEIKQFLHSFP